MENFETAYISDIKVTKRQIFLSLENLDMSIAIKELKIIILELVECIEVLSSRDDILNKLDISNLVKIMDAVWDFHNFII